MRGAAGACVLALSLISVTAADGRGAPAALRVVSLGIPVSAEGGDFPFLLTNDSENDVSWGPVAVLRTSGEREQMLPIELAERDTKIPARGTVIPVKPVLYQLPVRARILRKVTLPAISAPSVLSIQGQEVLLETSSGALPLRLVGDRTLTGYVGGFRPTCQAAVEAIRAKNIGSLVRVRRRELNAWGTWAEVRSRGCRQKLMGLYEVSNSDGTSSVYFGIP